MRLYVLVTSHNPLTIYLYRSGFGRFTHYRYDLSDIYNNGINLVKQKCISQMWLSRRILIIMMKKEEENIYLINLDFIFCQDSARKPLKKHSSISNNQLSRLLLPPVKSFPMTRDAFNCMVLMSCLMPTSNLGSYKLMGVPL